MVIIKERDYYDCYTGNFLYKVYHDENNIHNYHREDGPAMIYDNGIEEWYYHCKPYSPDKMPLVLFLAYVKWEYKKLNGN